MGSMDRSNGRQLETLVSGVDSECAVAVAGKGGTCGRGDSDTACMQMLEGRLLRWMRWRIGASSILADG